MNITLILPKAPIIMSNGLLAILKERFKLTWTNVEGEFSNTSFKFDKLLIKKA